jgi:hypothetical protein
MIYKLALLCVMLGITGVLIVERDVIYACSFLLVVGGVTVLSREDLAPRWLAYWRKLTGGKT